MRQSLPVILAAALAALLGIASCDSKAPASGAAPPITLPIKTVCTVGMITDIVREIGGDRVAVTGMMGEGVDPHLYKASPADVRLLTDADMVFYNGLNLEGKLGDVLVKLARDKPVIAVAAGIDESLLRSPPEFAGHHDPHVWFDVSLWMTAAKAVRDALIQHDPAGKEGYTTRADRYLQALEVLHQEIAAQIKTIPESSRILVTAHDAFGYFGRAYGIEVRAIQGISTESEAGLKDINDLVDLLVARKVPAVFIESSVPRKSVDALVEGSQSRGHTVVVGGELFSDAMGKEGTPEGTYLGMVRHNVRTIVEALGGTMKPKPEAAAPGGTG